MQYKEGGYALCRRRRKIPRLKSALPNPHTHFVYIGAETGNEDRANPFSVKNMRFYWQI
jgi:hypothetical protein